jgi:putative ABC transport system substrate-binding protein
MPRYRNALGALLLCCSAAAKETYLIGYLASSDAKAESAHSEGIRQALRDLGYIEGRNITVEDRYAEGNRDRASKLASELVDLNADVILVAGGTIWVRTVKNATKTIPIVMTGAGLDPVASGLVKSLARPGSNVTGLTTQFTRDVGGKRLELAQGNCSKNWPRGCSLRCDDSRDRT